MLERCSVCQVIRIYDTKTKNCNIVHSATEIVRLSDGPNGSIVVLDADGLLSKLEWSAETQRSLRTHVESLSFGRKIQKICYVKCHDIFVAILSDNNKQIMAWKPGNYYSPTWKLTGSVNGVNIDPVSLTSDTEGNVYIDDGANDRILKINSFTGNVLSIFLLKNNWETMRAIFWCKSDGNLIVQRDNRISSYSFTE